MILKDELGNCNNGEMCTGQLEILDNEEAAQKEPKERRGAVDHCGVSTKTRLSGSTVEKHMNDLLANGTKTT